MIEHLAAIATKPLKENWFNKKRLTRWCLVKKTRKQNYSDSQIPERKNMYITVFTLRFGDEI